MSVASHYPHKNLDTLLRAFAKARRKLPDHRLVLVGQWRDRLRGVKAGGGSELTELARALGLEGVVVMTGHVPDDKLGQLYRHAEVFVLPSRFEGFGMPAVEALGMGLPTVTTRCGSLPEATRELAVYLVDPLDVQELAEKLVEVALRRDAYRPSPEDAHSLREFYAPRRIAGEYLSLLTG